MALTSSNTIVLSTNLLNLYALDSNSASVVLELSLNRGKVSLNDIQKTIMILQIIFLVFEFPQNDRWNDYYFLSWSKGIIGFDVNLANDLLAVANSGEIYHYDFNKLLISDLT